MSEHGVELSSARLSLFGGSRRSWLGAPTAAAVLRHRAVKPAELKEKLQWLLDQEGPCLLEIVTDQKVPVLPMVPGGSALHELIIYDEGMPYLNSVLEYDH